MMINVTTSSSMTATPMAPTGRISAKLKSGLSTAGVIVGDITGSVVDDTRSWRKPASL